MTEETTPTTIGGALSAAAAEMEAEEPQDDTAVETAPETEVVDKTAAEETETELETAPETAPETTPQDDTDTFQLTPEERAAIKGNPTLEKLRKALHKSYTTKTQENAEALRLAEAFKKDPDGVIEAAARFRGYKLDRGGDARPAPPPVADVSEKARSAAAEKIEKLFGPEAGPVVREVFEEFAKSVVTGTIQPLQATLANEVQIREVNRMVSEEGAFKSKHRNELTQEIEAEMVSLGTSGAFVPGPNQTPGEYLESLYEIVSARRVKAKGSADIAARIQKNKREAEPTRGVSSRGNVMRASKVSEARSLSEAFKMANDELEREGFR